MHLHPAQPQLHHGACLNRPHACLCHCSAHRLLRRSTAAGASSSSSESAIASNTTAECIFSLVDLQVLVWYAVQVNAGVHKNVLQYPMVISTMAAVKHMHPYTQITEYSVVKTLKCVNTCNMWGATEVFGP